MKKIYFFGWDDKEYGEFSNFAFTPYVSDMYWDTAIHEFIYRKAELFNDENIKQAVLRTADPSGVRRLGTLITNFNKEIWDKVKFKIMKDILRSKFCYSSNKSIRNKLMLTGKDTILVLSNPNCKIWGSGKDKVSSNTNSVFDGQNLMGKALMEIRTELRDKYYTLEEINA